MKNLKIMNMLLVGILTLGSLASCSSDKDEEPEVQKVSGAKADYVVNLSQDLLKAATVTVYYIESNGRQAQEEVTSTTWTKSVRFSTLPTNAGFSVQPRLNGAPTQDAYTIEADGKMTVTVLDQKGVAIGSPFVGSKLEVKGQLGADFLGQYMTRIGGRLYDAKSIAADGTISDTTISWGGNADSNDPNRDTEVTTEGATGETRGE